MKERIVTVSGGFDPVHIGHIRMIREAAKLGKLIVILNNDAFLMRKKGFVFMPLEERKELLENIKGVDSVFVAIDEDDSVCKSLEYLSPDIFANGGDRNNEKEIREAEVCRRLGIEMVFNVGGGKVQSSSSLTKTLKLRKD
jgi:cytidyltransferase-like protein